MTINVMIMFREIMPQYPMRVSYDIISSLVPISLVPFLYNISVRSLGFSVSPVSCSILLDFYGVASLFRSTFIEPFAGSSVPVHFM